jgi:hypothetical protein
MSNRVAHYIIIIMSVYPNVQKKGFKIRGHAKKLKKDNKAKAYLSMKVKA